MESIQLRSIDHDIILGNNTPLVPTAMTIPEHLRLCAALQTNLNQLTSVFDLSMICTEMARMSLNIASIANRHGVDLEPFYEAVTTELQESLWTAHELATQFLPDVDVMEAADGKFIVVDKNGRMLKPEGAYTPDYQALLAEQAQRQN